MKKIRHFVVVLLLAIGLSGCTGLTSGDDGPPVVRPAESSEEAGHSDDE